MDVQLHRSKPINPSGFKIALELLLKSPSPSSLPEIPYSFGLRTSGTSKLSSKIMVKYVGQLVSLYVWSWGIFFHLLLATGVVGGLKGVEIVWRERKRRVSRGREFPLGGYHPDAGVPPLSPKAKGRSSAARALTGAGGGGVGGGGSWFGGGGEVLERKRFV
jgi:dolichol-phosphate mannosyltransferase